MTFHVVTDVEIGRQYNLFSKARMLLKMKRNAIDNYSSTIIGENHNYLGK